MYQDSRKKLAEICHLLYERRLVFACDGNVSHRVSDEHILMTPSGKNKGFVTAEEILVLDLSGKTVWGNGKASKEYPMHQAVYRSRVDVMAVVHTHPVYATAFALAGKNLPENYLIELPMMLKKTALAGYANPGTGEMADVILAYVMDCDAILLKNHGAVTLGSDMMDAFQKMEVLESIAQTVIMSKIIGKPEVIPEADIMKMKNR